MRHATQTPVNPVKARRDIVERKLTVALCLCINETNCEGIRTSLLFDVRRHEMCTLRDC